MERTEALEGLSGRGEGGSGSAGGTERELCEGSGRLGKTQEIAQKIGQVEEQDLKEYRDLCEMYKDDELEKYSYFML